MKLISIIGTGRKSGKTYLLEKIIKELVKKNIKFAVIKKIHKKDFTIDTEGKDTFRYYKSGAKDIYIYSKNEIVYIKKTKDYEIRSLLELLQSNKYQLVLFEGNVDLPGIKKILVSKDEKTTKEILNRDKSIKLIASFSPDKFKDIKVLDLEKDLNVILNFILNDIES